MNVDDPLKDKDIIHKMSVVTAHYAYRNGPIEDMHADRNKSIYDDDIKVVYDFMKFKLEVVFSIILTGNKEEIKKFLAYGIFYGQSWDYAVPEVLTFEEFLQKLQAA